MFDPTAGEQFRFRVLVRRTQIVFDGEMASPGLDWSASDYPDGSIAGYYFLRHCETCIFVYDVREKASFDAVKWDHHNLHTERSLERSLCPPFRCSPTCTPKCCFQGTVFVIANKIDRNQDEWQVTIQEAEDYCASTGATFIPISSKTGKGVASDTQAGTNILRTMTYRVLLRRLHNIATRQVNLQIEKEEPTQAASLHSPAQNPDWCSWY